MSAEAEQKPTAASVLRGWAADADEAMAAPLLALAEHSEQELSDAKVATELAVLAVVADAFEAPVQAEAFALAAAVRQMSTAMAQLIAANKGHIAAEQAALSTLWSVARAVGMAPEDHGALNHGAIIDTVNRHAGIVAAVRKALA